MTPEQLATLKTALQAETDPSVVTAIAGRNDSFLRDWCNSSHPSTKAWNSVAQWVDVADAIDGAKYTPSAANTPTDTAGLCRLVAILIKLTAQQNMLLMTQNGFDARDAGSIDWLLDTVTTVPSGSAGANTNPGGAGGVNVANKLARQATRAEAYIGGSDMTKGTVAAKVLSWEGQVSTDDIGMMFNP